MCVIKFTPNFIVSNARLDSSYFQFWLFAFLSLSHVCGFIIEFMTPSARGLIYVEDNFSYSSHWLLTELKSSQTSQYKCESKRLTIFMVIPRLRNYTRGAFLHASNRVTFAFAALTCDFLYSTLRDNVL
jgi:hypothetical protein